MSTDSSLFHRPPPVPQPLRPRSRRHRAGGDAVAGSRFRRACIRSRRARRAAFRAEGEADHLSLHVRRTVAAGPVRLQAAAEQAARRAAAGLRARRPAAHGHVGQSVVDPAGRLAVQVHAARPRRRVVQRTAAAHGRRSPTSSCVVRSMFTESDQSRPRRDVLPDRLADRRPAEHGRVAQLRTRPGEREPAVVRRADHQGQRAASRSARTCGAAASSRRNIRACSSARRRIRCSISAIPPAWTRASRRMLLDRLRELHEHQFSRARRTRRFKTASTITRWPSACSRASRK